ncbi:MAG: bifunctional UDP-N-acetylglucosamine diphosphorylase/glucosamine-1-phosphate N-acetyltransferase GlmU [Pseudomonadota bacterium]|nr:bifunctional UDP-N-acetylglucosamine diphosphorylase/glucosamine-1-phosphate N-acetyltransferase GlmU [Pseudomonadota bacterium]
MKDGSVALTVVVLAAGQGKRMHSTRPKVMHLLGGKPILAHILDTARQLKPDAIRVVYGHGAKELLAGFPQKDLFWHLQSDQLGTGHAVAQALPDIPDDHQVLVLYGDVPLVGVRVLQALVRSLEERALAILTSAPDDPEGYGRIIRDQDGVVIRIIEERDASDEERLIGEINSGLVGAHAHALRRWLDKLENKNAQGEHYLTDIVSMAAKEGVKVEGLKAADSKEVQGINDKMELAEAEKTLRHRKAVELMTAGVSLADPERVDVRGELSVGQDVFIDVGVVFEGNVQLGDRVHIGPYVIVSNCKLADNCVVHAHSVLESVVAGPNCEIGPFARLRPGTELAEQVKVGNFVEVKGSKISEGSKINHLSYVGDTTIGRDANIGAGTITCNYDGAEKHRTKIGDRAFVGSGVMLVAPVEVGEGATIGAGSVIAKDVPSGQLTVARAKQSTVKGWKRPTKPAK